MDNVQYREPFYRVSYFNQHLMRLSKAFNSLAEHAYNENPNFDQNDANEVAIRIIESAAAKIVGSEDSYLLRDYPH